MGSESGSAKKERTKGTIDTLSGSHYLDSPGRNQQQQEQTEGYPQVSMAMIYSVILCLFLKFSTCQLQCVKESLIKDFSLNVTKHIEAKIGECFRIQYELTVPKRVKGKVKMIWFEDSLQNEVSSFDKRGQENVIRDSFVIYGLPHGEYEYGSKLEFECNQTYIFPTRVRVSVSGFEPKPRVDVPSLKEEETAILICRTPRLCDPFPTVSWKQTRGNVTTQLQSIRNRYRQDQTLEFKPKAFDHNSAITCEVEYGKRVVLKKTVILNVKFAPRFLIGSRCNIQGRYLICVCISWGNPPSPISWPLASLTDYSVQSYLRDLAVHSGITIRAADYHNSSVPCFIRNSLGQRQLDILIQNSTAPENISREKSDGGQTANAALPWLIGVSIILNLVLLAILIFCNYKWAKRSKEKVSEEMNTYTTLNKAQTDQDYSVITPQRR